MSKRDTMLRSLRRQLGADYHIRTIDFEKCLYRDFGNGFNVEISGMHTARQDKTATLYLWIGDNPPSCMIVETVRNVTRDDIGKVADGLFAYTEQLIRDGYGNRDALFYMKHPQLKTTNINLQGGLYYVDLFFNKAQHRRNASSPGKHHVLGRIRRVHVPPVSDR